MAAAVDARATLQLVLDSDQFSAEMKQASREGIADIEKLEDQFEKLEKSAEGTTKGMKAVRTAINGVVVAVVARAFSRFIKDTIGVKTSLDSLRNTLLAVSETQDEANDKFDFAAQTAQRLGLELITTVNSFTQFDAAAAQTSLRGEGARKIFTSVSEAATVLGKSVSDTSGIFQALEQILNKGTVQAEEITKQFGQRVPGGFALAARALNITTQEFKKMLEQGEIVAEEFLPKLAVELDNTFGGGLEEATKSLRAELERMNTTLTLMKGNFAEGFADTLIAEFGFLGESAAGASKKGRELGEVFGFLISVVINTAKIIGGTLAAALTKITGLFASVGDKALGVIEIFAKFSPTSKEFDERLASMRSGLQATAAVLDETTTASLGDMLEGVDGLKDAWGRLTEGFADAGKAAEAQTVAVEELADEFDRLGETAPEALEAMAKQAEISEKALEALAGRIEGIRDTIADATAKAQAALAKIAPERSTREEFASREERIRLLEQEQNAIRNLIVVSDEQSLRSLEINRELFDLRNQTIQQFEVTEDAARKSGEAQIAAAEQIKRLIETSRDKVEKLEKSYGDLGIQGLDTLSRIVEGFEFTNDVLGTSGADVIKFESLFDIALSDVERNAKRALDALSDGLAEADKGMGELAEETERVGESLEKLKPATIKATATETAGLNKELETTVSLFREVNVLAKELQATI